MLSIWQFMSDCPFLTLFLAWLLAYALVASLRLLLRALNIMTRGWPPPHCDADGDFKPEDK